MSGGNYYLTNKKTGGKNGYGAKLTNFFSDVFIIETSFYNINNNTTTHYKQVCKNQFEIIEEPSVNITDGKGETFTSITLLPMYR